MVSVIFIFPVFSVFFLLSRPATKFRKTPSQAKLSSANLLHGNPHRRVSKMYSFWYMVMISYGVYYSTISNGSGLADFFHGQDVNRIEQLLSLTPILKRGPTVPIWFQNRHIQFIPWILQNELHKLGGGIPFQRLTHVVTDCLEKGSSPCLDDSLMTDTVTLDIFPPMNTTDEGFHQGSPVILFQPGLRCFSQDLPGVTIIRAAYGKKFRSVVVNRRGHTPNQILKAPRWNIFGDIDDLESVFFFLKDEVLAPNTAFFLHGISSGTAVTVHALAEFDKRRIEDPLRRTPVFVGATTLTPGYDIQKVMLPERFKWPYNPLMTLAVQEHFILQNEKILRDFDSASVDAALQTKNLQEFVNATVKFAGYNSTEEYYAHTNPVKGLHHITTPVLVLNSLDDPCCDINNLYEPSKFHPGQTYDEVIKQSNSTIVAITRTGSQCPFLDGYFPFVRDPLNGLFMLNSWADTSIIEYYSAAMEVYDDRRFLQ